MNPCKTILLPAVLVALATAPFAATQALNTTTSAVLPLTATAYGTALTAVIKIGGQPFNLLLDTGSADLWVLYPDWTCHEKSETGILGPEVPQQECSYGNGTYTPSSSFVLSNNAWVGVHYGAGDVLGIVGRDTVKIGNIQILQQEFGIANATNGPADNYSEGIMGLGYPVLSQTHPLNFTPETPFDLLSNTLPSVTTTTSLMQMYAEDQETGGNSAYNQFFAFALERTPLDWETAFGGYVGFGEIPPVAYSDEWTSVPVEVTKAVPIELTGGVEMITYWTLTIDAVGWNEKTYGTPYQAVVDTGNFYFIVPSDLAEQIAASFSPPGTFEPDGPLGPLYSVSCDAIPPSDVSITLGGKAFPVDSEDLIYRDFDGLCYSTFAPTVPLEGIQLFFLSAHFLRNAVAVFDYGTDQMRFAERIRNGTKTAASTNSTQPSSPEPSTSVEVQVENGASSLAGYTAAYSLPVLLAAIFW